MSHYWRWLSWTRITIDSWLGMHWPTWLRVDLTRNRRIDLHLRRHLNIDVRSTGLLIYHHMSAHGLSLRSDKRRWATRNLPHSHWVTSRANAVRWNCLLEDLHRLWALSTVRKIRWHG